MFGPGYHDLSGTTFGELAEKKERNLEKPIFSFVSYYLDTNFKSDSETEVAQVWGTVIT